jgi:hypothetical protein
MITFEEAYNAALRKTVYLPSRFDDASKGFVGGEWVVYGEPTPAKTPVTKPTDKRLTRPIIARGKTRQEAASNAAQVKLSNYKVPTGIAAGIPASQEGQG